MFDNPAILKHTHQGLTLLLDKINHHTDNGCYSYIFKLYRPGSYASIGRITYRQHLPEALHAEVEEKVASAENFRIALVGHLDQVPFPPGVPKWVRLLKFLAVALTALAVFTVLYVVFHGMPIHYLYGPILAAELMVVGAGVCAMTSLVARDRYHSRLLATVSTAVRQELRMAIQHGFANPITELAQNAYKTELPKLP